MTPILACRQQFDRVVELVDVGERAVHRDLLHEDRQRIEA
jgi:hypothetical protein